MTERTGGRKQPDAGLEEQRELSREEERAARDEVSELVGADSVDPDEQEDAEMLELDQTELEELGLTLDDPHQPESE